MQSIEHNEIDMLDIKFMREALKYAKKSLKSDDVPIGCIITNNNEIISRAFNQVEKNSSPTAHCEIIAINKAVKKIGYKHLYDCTLYVTLEPCSMCAGAIVLSRLKRVVIGTADPKTGACGSIFNIVNDLRLNHRCEVKTGVLKYECSAIIKEFFMKLRNK